MSIVYKGSPSLGLDKLPQTTIVAAILGTSAVITCLAMLFWLPYVHAKVVKKDYTIKWFHFFYGPLLWKREAPADAGQIGANGGVANVPDYRVRKDEDHDQTAVQSSCTFLHPPRILSPFETSLTKVYFLLSDLSSQLRRRQPHHVRR